MSWVNSKPILHRSDVIWSHCGSSQQPIYHLLKEIKLMWMDTTAKSCNVMYPQIVFSSRIVNANRVRPCNSSLQICNVECDKSLPRQPKLKSHWDLRHHDFQPTQPSHLCSESGARIWCDIVSFRKTDTKRGQLQLSSQSRECGKQSKSDHTRWNQLLDSNFLLLRQICWMRHNHIIFLQYFQ